MCPRIGWLYMRCERLCVYCIILKKRQGLTRTKTLTASKHGGSWWHKTKQQTAKGSRSKCTRLELMERAILPSLITARNLHNFSNYPRGVAKSTRKSEGGKLAVGLSLFQFSSCYNFFCGGGIFFPTIPFCVSKFVFVPISCFLLERKYLASYLNETSTYLFLLKMY